MSPSTDVAAALDARDCQHELLAELSRSALTADHLDRLFVEAASGVAETLDADRCAIVEASGETGRARLRCVRDREGTTHGGEWIDATVDAPVTEALGTGVAVVADRGTDDRFDAVSAADGPVEAVACVPVGPTEEPWGAIAAYATDAREFDQADVAVLETISNLIEAAIERLATDHRSVPSSISSGEGESSPSEGQERASSPSEGEDRASASSEGHERTAVPSERREPASMPAEELSRTVPTGIVAIEPDGAVEFVNDRAVELLGRSRAELATFGYDDSRWGLIDADGEAVAPGETPFDRVTGSGEPLVDETVGIRRPDGERIWLSVDGVPLDGAGGDVGAVFTLADVTDHHRIERELEEVFGRVSDAFYAVDESFRFTHVNERAEELLGYGERELLGECLWDVFPEAADEAVVREAFHAALESQEQTSFELYYEPLGFWVQATLHPSETGISVYFRDVSDRMGREAALEAERDLTERIVEIAPIGIVTLGADGSFDRVNDLAETIVGYAASDFDGIEEALEALQSVGPDGESYALEDHPVYRALVEGEPIHEVEVGVRRSDGERIWLAVSGSPLRVDGEPAGAVIAFADVTEQRETQRALRERERQLSTVMSNVPGMVYRCRNERGWPMEFVSDGCETVTGYAAETLLDESVRFGERVIAETDRERVWRTTQSCLADDEPFSVTYRIETADGATRWVRETGRVLVDDADGSAVLEGVIVDVTELKTYERRLEQYRALTTAANDVIVTIDESNTIQSVNPAVADVFGYRPDELVGESVTTLMPDGAATRHRHAVDRYLETGETTFDWDYVEFTGQHADGSEIPLALSFNEVEHDGERYFTGIVRDISQRKAVERELERQRSELRRTNRINELVQGLIRGLVEQPNRTEIERLVCAELAAASFYEAAWITDRPIADDRTTPAAWAGIELEAIEAIVDTDPPDGVRGLVRETLETGELRLVRDVEIAPAVAACRQDLDARGIESLLTIPIHYRDTVYGALVLCSSQSGAFDDPHRAALEKLGKTVGFAFAAAERKDALLADEVIELEVRVTDSTHFFFDATRDVDAALESRGLVSRADGSYVAYVTVTDGSAEAVLERAADAADVEHARLVYDGDEALVEFGFAEPTAVEVFAEYGGSVTAATAAGGAGTVTVDLPRSVDLRAVIDAFQTQFPESAVEAKQTSDRPVETERSVRAEFVDRLTDRQRETLQVAYHAGYLDRPRESSGVELAETLGISPSTFHQHRQAGLRKLLASVFDSGGSGT